MPPVTATPPTLASMTIAQFLHALAAKSPAPGGGAVAGLAGAIAADQARMVIAYTLGRAAFAAHEAGLREMDAQLSSARDALLRLADEDAAAYGRYAALKALAEGDPARAGLAAAADEAAGVPRRTLEAALGVMRAVASLPGRTNRHLASDLVVAAAMAEAAAASAAANVAVNLSLLSEGAREPARAHAAMLAAESTRLRAEVGAACGALP